MEIEKLRERQFWNSLDVDLNISDQPFATVEKREPCVVRDDLINECGTMLEEEGYFALPGYGSDDVVGALARAFDRLKEHQLHPVFIFVFDEAWALIAQLRSLFQRLLGDHDFLPAIWSWHVTSESQTAFAPHRDQVREVLIEDGDHLDYLTVWIPLTDIDHRSSAINLLPASADPDFEEGTPAIRVENLQEIRSLQGPRGSVFCWSTQVAHWGTRQSDYGTPRKSIGVYLQRKKAPCLDGPAIDFDSPLLLDARLAIIGQQIIDYSRTADDEELMFASKLVALASHLS